MLAIFQSYVGKHTTSKYKYYTKTNNRHLNPRPRLKPKKKIREKKKFEAQFWPFSASFFLGWVGLRLPSSLVSYNTYMLFQPNRIRRNIRMVSKGTDWVAPTLMTSLSERYSVYDGVYHTPLGRLSKLDRWTTKRVPIVPIPNHTYSESSRRDDSNAELCCTDTLFQLSRSSSVENRLRGW